MDTTAQSRATTLSKEAARGHEAYETRALVLQGGGALGAYQAGVYQGLAEAGITLTALAGISIGALNVALIAGNPPERQAERLLEFWNTICQPNIGPLGNPVLLASLYQTNDIARQFLGTLHAGSALLVGQQGFFQPRLPVPLPFEAEDPASVGYYDTRPLKATLESLCDFDRINDSGLHVSVGAVNVRSGNFVCFDNRSTRLRPEHFMASGALPPGFPAIEIEGEYYWDGGLVSNTPLSWILERNQKADTLVFQVDLWSAQGQVPRNLGEVNDRIQDIRYSSRTRWVTDEVHRHRKVQRVLRRLLDQLPEEERDNNPLCREATKLACSKRSNIIHLIYRDKPYEQHFRDFQFGPNIMREHWNSGLQDIRSTLSRPHYLDMPENAEGFVTHDIHRQAGS
ncbi:DUF3734 domain-containing protein [Castellaniella sp.]|uniref:DUF3734 domain-containing protein n=1 Tax=Castellaniella sp. TaxID=1955812 RepID=UPI003560FF23